MKHVVVAQCTKKKRSGGLMPAKELYYDSDYFRKQRHYAEEVGDSWYIQSAKHGLLDPDKMVGPYQKHVSDLSNPKEWAANVAVQLAQNEDPGRCVVTLLCGKQYTDPLTPELERHGFDIREPLRGMGIGERKQWLKNHTRPERRLDRL